MTANVKNLLDHIQSELKNHLTRRLVFDYTKASTKVEEFYESIFNELRQNFPGQYSVEVTPRVDDRSVLDVSITVPRNEMTEKLFENS